MAAIDRPYAPNARADSTPSTRALALVAVVGAAALAALAVIALLLAHRSPLTSDRIPLPLRGLEHRRRHRPEVHDARSSSSTARSSSPS